jgi:hypothetical protein
MSLGSSSVSLEARTNGNGHLKRANARIKVPKSNEMQSTRGGAAHRPESRLRMNATGGAPYRLRAALPRHVDWANATIMMIRTYIV